MAAPIASTSLSAGSVVASARKAKPAGRQLGTLVVVVIKAVSRFCISKICLSTAHNLLPLFPPDQTCDQTPSLLPAAQPAQQAANRQAGSLLFHHDRTSEAEDSSCQARRTDASLGCSTSVRDLGGIRGQGTYSCYGNWWYRSFVINLFC